MVSSNGQRLARWQISNCRCNLFDPAMRISCQGISATIRSGYCPATATTCEVLTLPAIPADVARTFPKLCQEQRTVPHLAEGPGFERSNRVRQEDAGRERSVRTDPANQPACPATDVVA